MACYRYTLISEEEQLEWVVVNVYIFAESYMNQEWGYFTHVKFLLHKDY